jgi:hypothetical protein
MSGVDPAAVARAVLDEKRPAEARAALVAAYGYFAPQIVTELAKGLGGDSKEEYRRIPWIWRFSIDAGRRNETEQLRAMLHVALPADDRPLADWQAVVVGGGVINGVSLAGAWPAPRMKEIVAPDERLAKRWRRAVELAAKMADDSSVHEGTRYDALRIVALDAVERSVPRLRVYLAKDASADLQLGAVAGLLDIDAAAATEALLGNLANLRSAHVASVLDGMLRTDDRAIALLNAVATKQVSREMLGKKRIDRLLGHPAPQVRRRAESVLSP